MTIIDVILIYVLVSYIYNGMVFGWAITRANKNQINDDMIKGMLVMFLLSPISAPFLAGMVLSVIFKK